ncbi:MAG: hypothetical protein MUF84_17765, partial [Anaerolineae bacterium]|nr:hypothetical protein [Anaerolineae bacterium]
MDWQRVLNQVRTNPVSAIDLRPAWRAMAYREAQGEPEPVVRARAFGRVLMEDALHFYEGDRLCGSHAGWFSRSLPDGLSQDEYEVLVAEHRARGQRDFWAGWDHSLADYPTLLDLGVSGLLECAQASVKTHECAQASVKTHLAAEERIALRGITLALEAFSAYMARWADAASARGDDDLAETARRVAVEPPLTFREAVQLVAFTHLAFESEGRYAMALGRVDQYLLPFYRRDVEAGRL